LVQCLLLLVVAAESTGRAAAPERVELIDEDDAGRSLARLLKEIANAGRADTDEHLHEFGTGNGEERDPGFTGHRPGEQNPLGNMGAEPTVAFGVLEKRHHFLQFEFCFLDASHISEGDFGVLFDIDLSPGLSDRHHSAKALAIGQPAPEKDPDQVEHQRGRDP
jgi:hypothetical protein